MIFVTKVIHEQTDNIEIGQRVYSDHIAVSAVWVLQQGERGVHYWRLDNHLLNLHGIKEQVLVKIVEQWLSQCIDSLGSL